MAEFEKTEKITINLGLVDLGEIDLLVGEGFYANRTDFIRSAIRRQLEIRSTAVACSVWCRKRTCPTIASFTKSGSSVPQTRPPVGRFPSWASAFSFDWCLVLLFSVRFRKSSVPPRLTW